MDPEKPNPYATPTVVKQDEDVAKITEFVRGSKRGPAYYIVLHALAVTFVLTLALLLASIHFEPIGFSFPFIGSLLGAVVYRFRSRNWPIDPSAKKRILIYSAIAIFAPSAVLLVLASPYFGPATFFIGGVVGVSIAAGIVISGTRRHGEIRMVDRPENAAEC